ncbi:hypothetical protein K439DRAFT_813237 [Ramaria rubella]|nr:hypothetical protein K439DRAFT_813237 [Ramaria rubella]
MSDNHRPMRQPHLVGNNVPTILPSIRTMGLPGFDSSSSGPSQLPQVARHSRYLDQYSYAEVHSLSSGLTSGQSWLDSVATSEGYMHLSDCARSVPSQLCPCKGQAGVRNTAVPTALSEGMHYRASSCRYEPEMRWNAKPYGIKKKSKGLL